MWQLWHQSTCEVTRSGGFFGGCSLPKIWQFSWHPISFACLWIKNTAGHTHTWLEMKKERVWHQWTEAVICCCFFLHTYSSAYTSAIESNKLGYMTASEEETMSGGEKKAHDAGRVRLIPWILHAPYLERGGRGGGGLGSLYHARGLSHAYTSPHACTQYTQEKKGKDASQPPRALNSSRESALRRPRQRGGSTVLFTHARCCIFSMTLSSRK